MKHSYTLTVKARSDLKSIMRYTLEKWGERKVEEYTNGLYNLLEKLAHDTNLGLKRNWPEFEDSGIRSFVYKSHVIYYTPAKNNKIRIIRILHQRQDIEKYFGIH